MKIKLMLKSSPYRAAAFGAVLFLAACGGGGMLATSGLFGTTVQAALARGPNDAPLPSSRIQQLLVELPVSFTTDPIDL